jgi:nucleotide-binding universal stress UspA family protein
MLDRILVAVDFSDASRAALVTAARLARRSDAAVDLLHVWQPPTPTPHELIASTPSLLERRAANERSAAEADMEELRSLLESLGASPDRELLAVGDPATEILSVAQQGNYDLVVVGTAGRRGLARAFLGSVAEKVLRHSPCPVLTVHAGDDQLAERTEARV